MMSPFIPLKEISFLIQQTLSAFESAALLTSDGLVLGLKYSTVTDIGTFGPFAQVASKYFKMQPGDTVLTNDPYSGGTTLSAMSLITPIQILDQMFYLAVRHRFTPRITHASRLEDEGIRIPPTPIATGRKINDAILSAIASHPQAPENFAKRMEQELDKVWRQIDLFKAWNLKNPNTFSKISQKALLQETRDRIKSKLNDLPHGDHRVDLQFESGEIIRLRTEISSESIHFDFAGTSNSKRMFLTNSATYGTCMAALLSFLGENFLLNDGVFSVVNVSTPQDCFLNAQYPAPVFEGLAEGAYVLASGVMKSLSTIASTKHIGLSEAIPTYLNYEFASGKIYYEMLSGGTGATAQRPGLNAHFLWFIRQGQPSVEFVEKEYPVLVLQNGIRQGSGGKGKLTGGNGTLKEIELLEDCTLKWLLGNRNIQAKVLKGGAGGLASEISILKPNGEKKVISEAHGEMKLQKGDKVIAASAGGGGFGSALDSLKNPTS